MSWTNVHPALILCFLADFIRTCNAQAISATTHPSSIVFPADNEVILRTLSSAVHLLGVSVLAYCLARRTDKLSARGLTSIPVARWLVILIFVDSWLFLFSAGLLISGVGLSLNSGSCSAGIFLCIGLYAVSKLLIYWFLVEKVHLVHPNISNSRLKSPAYRLCILFVFGYAVIIILMINGRISYIRDGTQMGEGIGLDREMDGACVIGLGRAASMSMLIYDLALNVFFTCMFLYPLYKSTGLSPRLKAIARRTLIAALVALITSAVNVCVLTALHGQELGWVCLASCGADVAVNALAIYAVTSSFEDHVVSESTSSMDKESVGRRLASSVGLGRMLPKPRSQLFFPYPIPNASPRGILETSNPDSRSTDIVSNTLSVHFSPDATRQSRGPITTDPQETDDSLESVYHTKKATLDVDLSFSSLNTCGHDIEANGDLRNTEYRGLVTASRLGRRETLDVFQPQPRVRPSTAPALRLIQCSQVDPGEDTTVVVRHEGPGTKNFPRNSNVILSTINSRKRSRSVEVGEEQRSDIVDTNRTAVSCGRTPATLEEARNRIMVLSALTEITGGGRRSQADQNRLEISVVTQMDQRIETRKRPSRSDLLDDYHGRQHGRRGGSFSSSGGL